MLTALLTTRDGTTQPQDELRAVTLDHVMAIDAYQRVLDHVTDPLLGVVLANLVRQANDDLSLLRRIATGAFDACDDSLPKRGCPEARDGVHSARMRAQELRRLASAERAMHHAGLALLLETIAADADREAHVLTLIGQAHKPESSHTPAVTFDSRSVTRPAT